MQRNYLVVLAILGLLSACGGGGDNTPDTDSELQSNDGDQSEDVSSGEDSTESDTDTDDSDQDNDTTESNSDPLLDSFELWNDPQVIARSPQAGQLEIDTFAAFDYGDTVTALWATREFHSRFINPDSGLDEQETLAYPDGRSLDIMRTSFHYLNDDGRTLVSDGQSFFFHTEDRGWALIDDFVVLLNKESRENYLRTGDPHNTKFIDNSGSNLNGWYFVTETVVDINGVATQRRISAPFPGEKNHPILSDASGTVTAVIASDGSVRAKTLVGDEWSSEEVISEDYDGFIAHSDISSNGNIVLLGGTFIARRIDGQWSSGNIPSEPAFYSIEDINIDNAGGVMALGREEGTLKVVTMWVDGSNVDYKRYENSGTFDFIELDHNDDDGKRFFAAATPSDDTSVLTRTFDPINGWADPVTHLLPRPDWLTSGLLNSGKAWFVYKTFGSERNEDTGLVDFYKQYDLVFSKN